jgi:hypothetical protein
VVVLFPFGTACGLCFCGHSNKTPQLLGGQLFEEKSELILSSMLSFAMHALAPAALPLPSSH